MKSRLAACDPCRRSKLACDHKHPVCTRCRSRDSAAGCVYRDRPFKRKSRGDSDLSDPIAGLDENLTTPRNETRLAASRPTQGSPSVNHRNPVTSASAHRRHRYPNPGFLGSLSHETIFNQFPPEGTNEHDINVPEGQVTRETDIVEDNEVALRGVTLLKDIHDAADISDFKDLLFVWASRGVNFALAGPFLSACIRSVHETMTAAVQRPNWQTTLSTLLLKNTYRPFSFSSTTTMDGFVAQFTGRNIRWETLGLFFAAVTQATIVVESFTPLYSVPEERQRLQKLVTAFSDRCLEISIALDCLNDLGLIFHFENCIIHSFVDGDQSFRTWRKLGDVASSLFALGYHEHIEVGPLTSPDIAEMRKAAFARIYSADKNMSLFLGRPCRINGRFCHFQLPTNGPSGTSIPRDAGAPLNGNIWSADEEINYMADTKWSAMTALLKEEILELFRDTDKEHQLRKAGEIQTRAYAQWEFLPAHFRIENSVKDRGGSAFEKDFLLHTRLNHLQILFLLRLMLVRRLSEPDASLLSVSQDILSLVVEAIVLRDKLVNAGVSNVWKVAYFGLPAAGIITLALLNNAVGEGHDGLSRSKMLRDLTVLVAQVQIGGVVQLGDPNYALLSSATLTIQNVMNVVDSRQRRSQSDPMQQMLGGTFDDDWNPWMNAESWEFEFDFWRNLAGHPSLAGMEHAAIGTDGSRGGV